MTKLDALKELLAKVEAGGDDYFDDLTPHLGVTFVDRSIQAYNGSIDAAKALHEAVLPECHYSIDSEDNGVCVFNHLMDNAQVGQSDNIARAWLIAIIKALIEMDENK